MATVEKKDGTITLTLTLDDEAGIVADALYTWSTTSAPNDAGEYEKGIAIYRLLAHYVWGKP